MLKQIIILFACSISCFGGISQRLPLTVYSNGDGPIQNGASRIFQDSKGWMWFLAGTSVIRYDGHRFRIIHPAAGVRMEYCYNILGFEGETWLMCNPYPLIVSGDSLRRHPYFSKGTDIVASIRFKGKQYFSCEDGLYLFENKQLKKVIHHSRHGDNRNEVFVFNDSLLIGNFFREGIFVFNMNRFTAHYMNGQSGQIRQDNNGHTYIHLLNQGICRVNAISLNGNDCNVSTELVHPLKVKEAGYFIFDEKGHIWVFSSRSWLKNILPDKTQKTYTEASGFPGFVFMDIFKDREHNIWLAHPNGVSKITEQDIKRYTESEGLKSNHIDEFFKTPDNRYLLVGTKNGASVFNGTEWKPLLWNGNPVYFYKTVFSGDKQYLLADSSLSEVKIDYSVAKVTHLKKIQIIQGGILEADVDKAGAIYITTHKGVFRYYRQRLTVFDSTKLGRAIYVDSQNRLWIGGWFDGLDGYSIRYINDEPRFAKIHFAKPSGGEMKLPAAMLTINEDGHGNLLVGTRGSGLFYVTLRGDTVVQTERLTTKDKLRSDYVRRIDIDEAGDWWLATDLGVNHVSGKAGHRVVRDKGDPYNITRVNTLQYFNDAVWIGNYPGVVALKNNPAVHQQHYQVYITNILVNNIDRNHIQPAVLKLRNKENSVSFMYSANSFHNEKAVLYTYQLQHRGDTSWSAPSAEHQVNFSALQPGRYIFRVKALDQSGQWSSSPGELSFRILPPFWQRGWFIILSVLAISGILYALYRYRIAQLTKMQAMRNSISHDLHDDIGASLTNILILNDMTRKTLDEKEKAITYLSRAGDDIKRISESLSDIVWNISPRYDDLGNLFIRMKRYAAEMLEGKNIEAEIQFPEQEIRYSMTMDQRRDFYLFFKEVINNLVKHSGATRALISISIKAKDLFLLIKDNGKGFDQVLEKPGNGLTSLQQRASKLDGELMIQASPGTGTLVSLALKL